MEKRKSQGFDFMGSDTYGWPLPARRTQEAPRASEPRPAPPAEPRPAQVAPVVPVEPVPMQPEAPTAPTTRPAPPLQPQPVEVAPVTPVEPVPAEPEVPIQPTTRPAPPLEPQPVQIAPVAPTAPITPEPPCPLPEANEPTPVKPPAAVFVNGPMELPWSDAAKPGMPDILCDLVPCERAEAPVDDTPERRPTIPPEVPDVPTRDGDSPMPVLYEEPLADHTISGSEPMPGEGMPIAQWEEPNPAKIKPRAFVDPETMLVPLPTEILEVEPALPTAPAMPPQRAVPRFQAPSIFDGPKAGSDFIPPTLPERAPAVPRPAPVPVPTIDALGDPLLTPEDTGWSDWRAVLEVASESGSGEPATETFDLRTDATPQLAYPPIAVDHPNDMAARQVLRLYAGEKSALTISQTYNYNSICFGEDCPQLSALMSRLSRETHGMAQALGRLALAFGADPRPRVMQSQRGQYWSASYVRCVRNPRKAILDLIDLERKLLSDMQRFENATRDSGAKRLMGHIIDESETRIGTLSHALTLGCV